MHETESQTTERNQNGALPSASEPVPRRLKFTGATAGRLSSKWETDKETGDNWKTTTFSFSVRNLPDEVAEELQTLCAYDSSITVTLEALQNNFMTQGTMLLVDGYTGKVNDPDAEEEE